MVNMLQVKFYSSVDDSLLRFAVIATRCGNRWVFCKHKMRRTYEIPGGHREGGETIEQAARRELQEETGAEDFSIRPICVYSVIGKNCVNSRGDEQFGMLYYAEVNRFEPLQDFEMQSVHLFDELPTEWTYPEIQPKLIERVLLSK